MNPGLGRLTAAALAPQCMAIMGLSRNRPGEELIKVGLKVHQWVSVSPRMPEGARHKGIPKGSSPAGTFWVSRIQSCIWVTHPTLKFPVSLEGADSCLRKPEGG